MFSKSHFLTRALSFLSLGFLAAVPAAAEPSAPLYEAQYGNLAMGTLVSARVMSPDKAAADRFEALLADKIDAYETLFTVHHEGPLYEVNRRAGDWVDVDCRIASLAETAKTIARDSDRAFEPTIGALVNVWKIGFGGEKVPERAAIDGALQKVDYTRIQTRRQEGKCAMRIGKGQSIDLGAIAKGWIGTALIADLKAAGATNAVIDLGGNVALLAKSPSGQDWKVGIQRPDRERGEILAVVRAADESVITSGAYERKIETNGKTNGHILSARTGMPAATDIASVTIVDQDGARADGWCTALFAMGVQKALGVMSRHKDLGVLILDQSLKKAWVSRCIADRVRLLDESIALTVVE